MLIHVKYGFVNQSQREEADTAGCATSLKKQPCNCTLKKFITLILWVG